MNVKEGETSGETQFLEKTFEPGEKVIKTTNYPGSSDQFCTLERFYLRFDSTLFIHPLSVCTE